MFYNCDSLTSIDLSGFVTDKATDMTSMFEHCISLKSIDLSNFNTVSLVSMSRMFFDCKSLSKVVLPSLNNEIEYLDKLFYNCYSLEEVNINEVIKSRINEDSDMFFNSSYLQKLNLSRI